VRLCFLGDWALLFLETIIYPEFVDGAINKNLGEISPRFCILKFIVKLIF